MEPLGPELVLVFVLLAAAMVLGLLLLAALVVGAYVVLRRRVPAGPSRDDMLRELGYGPTAPGTWARKVQGAPFTFTDRPAWRWTVRLPRYATMTLRVVEREGGGAIDLGREFATDDPALDRRFVMGSELAAQTVALVRTRAVANALLAMPWVSLRLKGDELVVDRPIPQPSTVEAEREAHVAVGALVIALFGALYSTSTGTLMPEHR